MALVTRIRFVAALACVLATTVLVPGAGARPLMPAGVDSRSAIACRSSSSVLTLHSFHIEAEPSKKIVRRGQVFTVTITVTRPAHEDPADLGITYEPPMSTPEKDVRVGISLWTGERTYFYSLGLTDANGEDKLKIRVPKDAEPGKAYASVSAQKWIKQDCPDILEYGFREYPDFVVVAP
ncbi:MAG: hypothetical protein ACRDKT_07510 [Actinomycetota bacterium]